MRYRPPSSGGSYIAATLVVCACVALCFLIVIFFSKNPQSEVPVATVAILAVVFVSVAIGVSSVELPSVGFRFPWRRKRKVIRYELRRKRIEPPPVPGTESDRYGQSTWVPADSRSREMR